MKIGFTLLLVLSSFFAFAQTEKKVTPEFLVQQQLDGYNARDIDAFLAPYADDVELYAFPQKLIGKGKDKMRVDYSLLFKRISNLHCDLKNRTIMGNNVIDHESITGFGPKKQEAIAIYEIKNDKISKVYFIQ